MWLHRAAPALVQCAQSRIACILYRDRDIDGRWITCARVYTHTLDMSKSTLLCTLDMRYRYVLYICMYTYLSSFVVQCGAGNLWRHVWLSWQSWWGIWGVISVKTFPWDLGYWNYIWMVSHGSNFLFEWSTSISKCKCSHLNGQLLYPNGQCCLNGSNGCSKATRNAKCTHATW